MTVKEKIEKGFELANYLVLTLLITAQCTVGSNFFVGQFIYFSANVLAVVRCFVLKRPMADKVKDFCMLGITTGLILIKFLGGIRSQKGELKMTMQENLKDFIKLIEEAKKICSSHYECNEKCLFYNDDVFNTCIFETPPIDW